MAITDPSQIRKPGCVTVRVPATTANLGPGFDCLGLALDMWNETTISLRNSEVQVEVLGEGAGRLPKNEHNLVVQAVKRVYSAVQIPLPAGLHVRCLNRIPTGSGLGSSAAATLAGLVGANGLLGNPLDAGELLRLGASMEGHLDNLAAAYHGGLVLVAPPGQGRGEAVIRRVDVSRVQVALAVPDVRITTREARQALPDQVTMADAAFNLGRALLVVEALRHGDLELLGEVMQDRLHQPYRLGLIPGAEAALRAARAAGASAAALSGAGPGVVAFCQEHAQEIAEVMVRAFEGVGVKARGWGVNLSTDGFVCE
jgi:homoserine kinase